MRWPRVRARRDAGSVLIELALVMPLLAMVAFGTIEGGAAIVSGDRVAGAAVQAARIGASAGSRVDADRDLLVALRSALPAEELSRLDRVVVFKPAGANGAVPAGCVKELGDPSEQGLATSCNSYSGATVRSVSAASMLGFGGAVNNKDGSWPPSTRKDTLVQGPDYLGVWIRTVHPGVFGLVFEEIVVTRTSILRIQPDLAG